MTMQAIFATIFVLGVLIFVHELGHFLVAKWVGIRVERFSLGFPPKMIGKTVGDTEYCLSWIPLGGYVKMAGEIPDEGEITGAPDEFMSKKPGQRAAVIIAGPLMNVVTAFVIAWGVIFVQGKPEINQDHVIVGMVVEGGPAAQAGIETGDVIQEINGTPIPDFGTMTDIIYPRPGDSLMVAWSRGEQQFSAWVVALDTMVTDEKNGDKVRRGMIGINQGYHMVPAGLFESFNLGLKRTWFFTTSIFEFLGDLVTGAVSVKMVGGPVFIAKVAGEAARAGFSNLLWLMAFLSVNLAIVNVLPIPVLDGGHLIFLGIEKLRRRPLTLKQRAIAQQIGLFFILIFITFVTYNDFLR